MPHPVWIVSISGSGLAWALLGMGELQAFGMYFCFVFGQTKLPLFGTPDMSTLF